jgi:hypothetical protein
MPEELTPFSQILVRNSHMAHILITHFLQHLFWDTKVYLCFLSWWSRMQASIARSRRGSGQSALQPWVLHVPCKGDRTCEAHVLQLRPRTTKSQSPSCLLAALLVCPSRSRLCLTLPQTLINLGNRIPLKCWAVGVAMKRIAAIAIDGWTFSPAFPENSVVFTSSSFFGPNLVVCP